MGQKNSTVVVTVYVLILGSIVSLGFGPLSFIKLLGLGLLDFFDFLSNSVLMPIVANFHLYLHRSFCRL